MQEQTKDNKVSKLKTELQLLKKEINTLTIREGVIRNQVEQERAKIKNVEKKKSKKDDKGKASYRAKKIHIEGQSLNSS